MSRRNRVGPTLRQGGAPQNPPCSQGRSAKGPVHAKGLRRVMGTAGIKTAARVRPEDHRPERRNELLVHPHQKKQHARQKPDLSDFKFVPGRARVPRLWILCHGDETWAE